MAFQFPWANLHELNLDWFLSKFKQFTANYLSTTATVELIPTTEQPEVTVTGGTLDVDTDIVDPFTFNFKLPVNSSGGGAVDSVNGKVGTVVIDKTDIGLGNVANVAQYSASNPPPYPVTSVNGSTGAVTLDKTDIGLGNVANVAQYSASNPPPYPVTSVNGQTGDVIVSGSGAVDSVNGKTGTVVLDKTDIGLGNVANVAQYSASNPPPYPVTSVNGSTGAVTLDKTDIGLGNVANVAQYSASNPPPYPVTSVNGSTGAVTISIPVTSVNTKTGAVVLDKTDIGLGNVANVAQYSASNPPPYPVTSVNGSTGAVTGLQTTANLVTAISSVSTDTQYPSAKCVYDLVGDVETLLSGI